MDNEMWNADEIGNSFEQNTFAPNPFASSQEQSRINSSIESNQRQNGGWTSSAPIRPTSAGPYRRQSHGFVMENWSPQRPQQSFPANRRVSNEWKPPPAPKQPGPSIDDLAASCLQNFSLEATGGKPEQNAEASLRPKRMSTGQILPPNPWRAGSEPAVVMRPENTVTPIDALRVSEEASFSLSEKEGGSSNGNSYFGQPPPLAANPFISVGRNNSPYTSPYSVDSNDDSFLNSFSASNPFAVPSPIQTSSNPGSPCVHSRKENKKNCGKIKYTIEPAPEDIDAEAAGKRLREKKHALDELYTTECTYRDQLACFVEKLQRPLNKYCECLENEATRLGNPQDKLEHAAALRKSFAPLPAEQLLEISQELLNKLEQRQQHASDYSGCYPIGDLFASISEKMKNAMITWYDWHERADVELRRLAPKSIEVAAFAELAASDPRCGDHQVSSLLIAPTQRLVRQMLFLERLAKTTIRANQDCAYIIQAYTSWRETLEACNVSAGNRSMQRRAEAVSHVLDGAPENLNITAHSRLLTHEGRLCKVGGNSLREDYFFLFETENVTELLHTSVPDSSGRFGFRRFLKILHVEDVDLTSDEDTAHASGTVKRNSLYVGLPTKFASMYPGSLSRSSSFSDSGAAGGGPGANENAASDGGGGGGRGKQKCDLLLRLVACDPYDGKNGYIYSLLSDRESLLNWKSKVTRSLNRSTLDWKLRYKGDVTILAEGPTSFGLPEAKEKEKNAFMWFFVGKTGGKIVRATIGATRSGKLEWKELLLVSSIDGGRVPDEAIRGDKIKRKIQQRSDQVFRIVTSNKTLIVAAEEKQLIVDLMKSHTSSSSPRIF
uniref:DH domain-containing protein n=1 Tax=Aureoumbra lagunensis TaxID=44058 RepID=A0A7S3NIK0_9STRA|mmetsp:Transcript_7730/g.10765  ORF Transcript_7730/g.10765 Transcript_7730/m.10765 type:complete len:836 (+) Transcript_7730:63-2570(+)